MWCYNEKTPISVDPHAALHDVVRSRGPRARGRRTVIGTLLVFSQRLSQHLDPVPSPIGERLPHAGLAFRQLRRRNA